MSDFHLKNGCFGSLSGVNAGKRVQTNILDYVRVAWDNPIMKIVADSRGRLTAADLFRPGIAFDANRMPDGTIRLAELVEKEVPTVRPVRTKDGFLMSPVNISRKDIRAALRKDRDAQ